jgi:acyl-CoA thioester hydrolase
MDKIESSNPVNSTDERWFDYPIKVFPHHTDYGGVVWHGTYVKWLEEARIECLASVGVSFADFVLIGCDVIVTESALKYQKPLRLGDIATVKTRMLIEGIRLIWDYKIQSLDGQLTYLTGVIKLVPIDLEKQRVMRKLPSIVQGSLNNLSSKFTGA